MGFTDLPPELRTTAQRVLTRKQLDVLKLRLAGMSFRAIGNTLDVDEATVRGHWQRAVRKLRPHVEQLDDALDDE